MSLRAVIVSVAAVALLAGCAGTSRIGERASSARVMTLLFPLTDTSELQPLTAAVARLSHGSLRLRLVSSGHQGQTDYEAATIRDVQRGRAALGWAGSRAWDAF